MRHLWWNTSRLVVVAGRHAWIRTFHLWISPQLLHMKVYPKLDHWALARISNKQLMEAQGEISHLLNLRLSGWTRVFRMLRLVANSRIPHQKLLKKRKRIRPNLSLSIWTRVVLKIVKWRSVMTTLTKCMKIARIATIVVENSIGARKAWDTGTVTNTPRSFANLASPSSPSSPNPLKYLRLR